MRESWLRRWWWVILFSFFVSSIYLHYIQEKNAKLKDLSLQFEQMKLEKTLALQQKETLHRQIESQNDPSWIEMILMRDLGVVPEGWLKGSHLQ